MKFEKMKKFAANFFILNLRRQNYCNSQCMKYFVSKTIFSDFIQEFFFL